MLLSLRVQGYKSLGNVGVSLPRLAVLFGPNAVGKSNLLDAVQTLSRIASTRTLADALSEPIRGHPIEAFSMPKGGMPELLRRKECEFRIAAQLTAGKDRYEYSVTIRINPGSGTLSVTDERLASLTRKGAPAGQPRIEHGNGQLLLRSRSRPGRPRHEPLGLNYALLSDARLGGAEYLAVERCRAEMSGWTTYYLDPRVAMRSAVPPSAVSDIGVFGQGIAPYLYRLRAEYPKHFDSLRRTLRSLVPTVEALDVDLDEKRGTLDIVIRQNGVDYSSRVISEGTLRVLALCALSVNPWGGTLLAFEEPENGVHPRRLELIADLLTSLAVDRGRQVIVTTHSPLLCNAFWRKCELYPEEVGLFSVRRTGSDTTVVPFDPRGPLFADVEVKQALESSTEDGMFERLMLRGILDE
jgi:predicted ATPase